MPQWKIAILQVQQRLESRTERVLRRLEEAWTGPGVLDIQACNPSDLHDETLDTMDAVVLVDDGIDVPTVLYGLLSRFEEHSVPVLALTDQDGASIRHLEFSGALIMPLDIDDLQLCAVLQGLLHQQTEIRRLQTENRLAHRFQGGLRDEISKMHDEMQLAAVVQREFLPQEIPSLYGITFDALWRPAHYVSGDLYDIARLDEDHIGVLLADAAGHGVPAALMTMVIHRSLVTKEIRNSTLRVLPPGEVMARLNNGLIHRQGANGRFATAVYAVINCRSRTMAIAGAGHPPPKLIGADGVTTHIETTGSLLGVFENETFEQVEIALNVGDRLLLFSDGFEQAFPADARDGHNRKMPTDRYHAEFDAIARLHDPRAMIRMIKQRLDDQSGSLHQIDDLTLICMHAGSLPTKKGDASSSKTTGDEFSVTI